MKTSPILLGFTSAVLFGAATPASKALLTDLSAPKLAGLLYLGAAIGVLPLCVRSTWKGAKGVSARGWRHLAGAVLLGGVLGPLLLLGGLSLSPAGDASLILNLELAATAVLGVVLFREQLSASGFVAVLGITVAGAAVSYHSGLPGLAAGGLIALACLCWAFDNHWTAIVDAFSPAQITLLKGLVAGLFNLCLGLLLAPLTASPATVVAAIAVGAFSYGISITFYVEAAQSLGPTRAQGLFATAPFIGAGLSFALLAEPVSSVHLVAATLLAVSVVALLRAQHSHEHTHVPTWHVHLHSHDDGHHEHFHPPELLPVDGPHSHWHQHSAVTHAHPHAPDLHHRHEH